MLPEAICCCLQTCNVVLLVISFSISILLSQIGIRVA